MNFLHSHIPDPIAFTLGSLTVHWYGVLMALAIIAAIAVSAHIATRREMKPEVIYDAAVWLIIGGLIGARLYEGLLEWEYYSAAPFEIVKIWKGGLAIHGGLIGGAVALWLFSRRRSIREKHNVWNIAAVIAPGLALAQAIGRWGNWFNQELFGRPSLRPWSIPISEAHRPFGFEAITYFHPTFLYESIGLLGLALILFLLARRKTMPCVYIVSAYLIGYGLLRFVLEFIKIDATPLVLGFRWPQVMSLFLVAAGIGLFLKVISLNKKAKP